MSSSGIRRTALGAAVPASVRDDQLTPKLCSGSAHLQLAPLQQPAVIANGNVNAWQLSGSDFEPLNVGYVGALSRAYGHPSLWPLSEIHMCEPA